jgi:hypothetical protein
MEKEIRNNLFAFYQPVSMPGGWTHDHVETLKFNHLYYYGKYATGDRDAQGYYKFFKNITKPTCDIATKFVDLDTKDINLFPVGGSDTNAMYTWMMQRELRIWLIETGFGKLLNTIATEFPKGHVVLKKTKNGFKKVPIVSMRMDPSIPKLEKGWHAELHMMTLDEIKAEGWDTEELKGRPNQKGVFDIYETYVKEGSKWRRVILGGLHDVESGGSIYRTPESRINEGLTFLPPIKFDDSKVDRTPYRELKWEDVEGRWLGFGYPEYLKDNQISENETENLERKALILKALQLYQSTDEGIVGKNVLTDTQNGDILISADGILPVAKDNSDLSAYNNTRQNNQSNIERKTFTSDITTGASLPSRTPLGVANLQASLATSYFELKREDFGLFLKDMLWEDIIPDFKKKNGKSHAMDFIRTDEDRRKAEKLLLDLKEWEYRAAFLEKTGFKPTIEQVEMAYSKAKEQLSNKENLSLKLPPGVYNDAKFRLDITVTGENIDISAKSSVLQIALQTLGSNPMILQDEATRTIFLKFLSLGGFTLGDLNIPEATGQQMPQGGSIATPQPAQTTVGATAQQI